MATKKKKKENLEPPIFNDLEEGEFVWPARMFLNSKKLETVYIAMNGAGTISAVEDGEGNTVDLNLIKPFNPDNCIYKKSQRQELGRKYGFIRL